MRKLLLFLLLSVFLILVLSCEKDENVIHRSNNIHLPQYYIAYENDTTFFNYSGNLLLEVCYSGGFLGNYKETFDYNNHNKIIRSNIFINKELVQYFEYEYKDDLIFGSTLYVEDDWKKQDADNTFFKKRYNFGLNAKKSIENNTNEFVIEYQESYEYDIYNKLTKTNTIYPNSDVSYYTLYEYDINGNVLKTDQFKVTNSSKELYSQEIMEYGDAYFCFKDLNLPPNYGVFYHKNNVLSRISNYYYDGAIDGSDEVTYIYHSFTEYNYPISFTMQYGDFSNEHTINEVVYN